MLNKTPGFLYNHCKIKLNSGVNIFTFSTSALHFLSFMMNYVVWLTLFPNLKVLVLAEILDLPCSNIFKTTTDKRVDKLLRNFTSPCQNTSWYNSQNCQSKYWIQMPPFDIAKNSDYFWTSVYDYICHSRNGLLCSLDIMIRGALCLKHVSKADTSNYIPQYLWYVITYPCPCYQLLTLHSSYSPAWLMSLEWWYPNSGSQKAGNAENLYMSWHQYVIVNVQRAYAPLACRYLLWP